MILTVVAISKPSPLSSNCCFLFKYSLCSIKQLANDGYYFYFCRLLLFLSVSSQFLFWSRRFLFFFFLDFIYLCYYFVFSNIHFFFCIMKFWCFLFSLVWRGESCVLEVYVENLNALKTLYVSDIVFICCLFPNDSP
jgi:hypothetical protein